MTEAAKHTPGPWRITGKATVRAGDDWIAKAHWRNAQANAHLIAAAPDMLAALKQLNHTTRNGVLDDARRAEFNVAFKVARAAIAKAEGRS